MKLKDILLEVDMSGISNSDASVIGNMNTDRLEDLLNALDRSAIEGPRIEQDKEFQKYLHELGFVPTDFFDSEYYDRVMMAIEEELVERDRGTEDPLYDPYDYRDYDEEDRMAAWEDKYNAFRNEY